MNTFLTQAQIQVEKNLSWNSGNHEMKLEVIKYKWQKRIKK